MNASPATRGLSLRTRWTAALLLVAAVPLAVLSWVTARTVRQGLTHAERDLQVSIIDRVAYAVGSELDYAGESSHRVGATLLDQNAGSPELRTQRARETMARASALLHVAVYAPSGERVDTIYRTADGARDPAALERIPAPLLAAPPETGTWMRAEFTPSGVAIRYVEALRDGESSQVLVWLVGTLNPRWLDELAQNISLDRYHAPHRVIVVDDSLRLLVSGTRPVGSSLAHQDIFSSPDALRSQDNRDFSLSTEYSHEGERMVGTLQAIRRVRWLVAVRRSQREAYAALTVAQRAVAVGGLLCVALAAALGAVLARRTTKPIDALVSLTGAYAARRFSERSTVKTGDELETLGGALESMATNLQESEAEIARKTRIEGELSRFLPAEVASAVARGEKSLALGGVRRNVAVLFADVASFTSFSEGAAPEKVVAFLNELFTVLTEVVFRHGGMVDKFLGDCVMAVFGTGSDPRDAAQKGADMPVARALAAAEDIHRFVEASAPAWLDTYGIDVRLGIGVNVGEALVGNLGSESRMEYTVIGDVVNVAARLEGLARGGQTLATGAVVRIVGSSFSYNPLGEHPLRGKREMVEIFEVTS